MRLLDTKRKTFQEFFEANTPPYAILSHTWRDEEVTLQDMLHHNAKKKKGYRKICECCLKAVADGYDYVWIDSCCIDKTSSAELSEAINSMFRWYKKAAVCYAYLDDVPYDVDPTQVGSVFWNARWFTRGFTLQELLAPARVVFFSDNWTELCTKRQIHVTMSRVLGIPSDVLTGADFRQLSIAKRMSWAARRQTSRTEDIAYCLLGIFDIHMPLLYGEGKRAFTRLQEEIMKVSDDQSLFAWGIETTKYVHTGRYGLQLRGILAQSPAEFAEAGAIVPYIGGPKRPFTMTNIGLQISLPFFDPKNFGVDFKDQYQYHAADLDIWRGDISYGILRCHDENKFADHLSIPLVAYGNGQYARRGSTPPISSKGGYYPPDLKPVCLLKDVVKHHNLAEQQGRSDNPTFIFGYTNLGSQADYEKTPVVLETFPPQLWDQSTRTIQRPPQPWIDPKDWHVVCLCELTYFEKLHFILIVGYSGVGHLKHPWFRVENDNLTGNVEQVWERTTTWKPPITKCTSKLRLSDNQFTVDLEMIEDIVMGSGFYRINFTFRTS